MGLFFAIIALILIAFIIFSKDNGNIFSQNPPRRYKKYTHKPSAEEKGEFGEQIVNNILGYTIPGKQYLLNNVILEISPGKTTQIDHIFINQYGIWVIETKNWNGTIFGKENDNTWTVVYNGNNKKFYDNPIKQNKHHEYFIKHYLGNKAPILGLIVFVNGNTKNVNANGVCHANELPYIVQAGANEVLSPEKMEQCYNELNRARLYITNQEHVTNLQLNRQHKIEQGICPWCNGTLIMRYGDFGNFLGCSNYPKCQYKKDL